MPRVLNLAAFVFFLTTLTTLLHSSIFFFPNPNINPYITSSPTMKSAAAPRRSTRARCPRVLNKVKLTPEEIHANRGKSAADYAEYERTLANAAKKDSMTELPEYNQHEYFVPDTVDGREKPSAKKGTLKVPQLGRLQKDPKDFPLKFTSGSHSKGPPLIQPRVSRVMSIRYWRRVYKQRRALGSVGANLEGTAFVEEDDSEQNARAQASDDDATESAPSTINEAGDDRAVLPSVETE